MPPELLTVAEFAGRLKVSRSKVFEWLRQSVFIPGEHYVKIGRVLRFVWTEKIVSALSNVATQQHQSANKRSMALKSKQGINWNY